MSVVNRDLGANIHLVLFGHWLLALAGLSLVVARIPLPATVELIVVCACCSGCTWRGLRCRSRTACGESRRQAHQQRR